MDFHVCKLQSISTHFCWSLWHLECNFKGLSWIQDCMRTLWHNFKMPFLKLLKCNDPYEPTMSFISVALVGMVCSPRRLAKRRDFSRAISSNSRCLSVSLRDTGIGMARVARTTLVAILTRKKEKHYQFSFNKTLLSVYKTVYSTMRGTKNLISCDLKYTQPEWTWSTGVSFQANMCQYSTNLGAKCICC